MRARSFVLAVAWLLGTSSCRQLEPFARFDYRVVDAEYSQSLGVVLLASAGPPTLHLYDPVERLDQPTALSLDPTCLAVSPDGRYAAVGHDHLVSYVDLATGSVIDTFPVSIRVFDIVMADNGHIYAFPYSGQLIAIDVGTGAQAAGERDWGWSAQQQPGTKNVYAVIGENLLRNFDISSGSMAPGYFAPYWYPQDHRFCSKLWLSQDGRRIFTGCGHTFRASSSIDQDMRYVGSLSGLVAIEALSDSPAANHVLVIPGSSSEDPSADTRLQLYHDAYLEYRGSLQLPPFSVDDAKFPAHGRYVFFDVSGRYFIAIVQADESAGLTNDFAAFVVTFTPRSFKGASGPTPPPVPAQTFATFGRIVVDAEYDAPLDRIVYVSSDPSALHVVDAETVAEQVVSLPLGPTSVSISPDGTRAAVGHRGRRVSIVDLESATLVATYTAYNDVLDVVLADAWAYELPRLNGAGLLTGIEVVSGTREVSQSNHVTGDARAKLDATGSKLYVASNWDYPSWMALFDVSQHPSRYVRSVQAIQPGVCGDLWLSEDGLRIFTRCGAVLRSSTNAAADMSVEGRLAGLDLIRHLSDSTEAETIAAIPGVPEYDGDGFAVILPGGFWYGDTLDDTRVQLFEASSLSSDTSIELPDFVLGSATHPARGRFVFFNRLGTRVHVIVEADSAAGLVDGFGLVSFDIP